MNETAKNVLLWVIIAVVLFTVFQSFSPRNATSSDLPYSGFVQSVDNGNIATAVISADQPATITGKLKDGSAFRTVAPMLGFSTNAVVKQMQDKGVEVRQTPSEGFSLMGLLISWLPVLLIVGVFIWFMRQMQSGGGGRGAMSFGRSRAKLQGEDQIKVNFTDVAGCDEAKEEVGELVEFLRDPGRFQKLGGKIPRGVLMVGPPGTGKTLLAKAIAGEAKVPFFSISGSDFVEMFVGVGASRVRFEGSEGVIVIAATNRPDVLDPALLRPGRFDRQVMVGLPDVRGRDQILKVHMRKVPTASDVDAMVIARGTPGFSGADLANLVNEAALFAARENAREVRMIHLDRARDKILMGTERRSLAMSEDEKKLTAYHEAGHAIVGRLVPEHDPVYKVTIIPRGRALGVTMYLPEGDKYSINRVAIESQLCSLYGGRVAEELIFGAEKVTTGASNDIERATKMARNMATKWGLSDELGPITYGEDEDEVFLGRSVTQHKSISNETASKIDEVVRGILDRAYARSTELLTANLDKLHAMAEALLQYETIDAHQIDDIMAGREPGPPADWVKDAAKNGVPPPPPPRGDSGSPVGTVGDTATQNRDRLDG